MEASNKLTLLHSEWPKLHRVLAFLSAIGSKVPFAISENTHTLCVSKVSVSKLSYVPLRYTLTVHRFTKARNIFKKILLFKSHGGLKFKPAAI